MAHVGQKIGLGPVGQFGTELGALQLLGDPLGLRDVGQVAVPQHTTVRGTLGLQFAMHPDRLAGVLVQQPNILGHGLATRHGMLEGVRQRGLIERMNPGQNGPGIGHRLLMGHAANSPDRGAAKGNGVPTISRQVELVDRHRHIGRDLAQPGGGVLQGRHVLPDAGEYGRTVWR